MKINTQKILKDLKGDNLKGEKDIPFTLGQALGNILASSKIGGKMKLYSLSIKLYQDKEVEVDASDLNLIKDAVEQTEQYNALITGQCELLLEDIK